MDGWYDYILCRSLGLLVVCGRYPLVSVGSLTVQNPKRTFITAGGWRDLHNYTHSGIDRAKCISGNKLLFKSDFSIDSPHMHSDTSQAYRSNALPWVRSQKGLFCCHLTRYIQKWTRASLNIYKLYIPWSVLSKVGQCNFLFVIMSPPSPSIQYLRVWGIECALWSWLSCTTANRWGDRFRREGSLLPVVRVTVLSSFIFKQAYYITALGWPCNLSGTMLESCRTGARASRRQGPCGNTS